MGMAWQEVGPLEQEQGGGDGDEDANEKEFETPRVESVEEAYRKELAHLLAEKRRVAKKKRGVLGASLEGLNEAQNRLVDTMKAKAAAVASSSSDWKQQEGDDELPQMLPTPIQREGGWWKEEGYEGQGPCYQLLYVGGDVAEVLREVERKRAMAKGMLLNATTLDHITVPPPKEDAERR